MPHKKTYLIRKAFLRSFTTRLIARRFRRSRLTLQMRRRKTSSTLIIPRSWRQEVSNEFKLKARKKNSSWTKKEISTTYKATSSVPRRARARTKNLKCLK